MLVRAYRRLKNLSDLLVTAEVKRPHREVVSTKEKIERLNRVQVDYTAEKQTRLTSFFNVEHMGQEQAPHRSRSMTSIPARKLEVKFVAPNFGRNKCTNKTCR